MLAVRLLGRGNPGTFKCGNGIHALEWLALQNAHNGEIIRSFHEAAAHGALVAKQNSVAKAMLPGLALRVENGVKAAEQNKLPKHLNDRHLFDLLMHSAQSGVPLTWREVRFLHKQIDKAYKSYKKKSDAVFRVFHKSTPDGAYPFTPDGDGIYFRSLALPIGTCTASYRNPASKPVLDCARLKKLYKP